MKARAIFASCIVLASGTMFGTYESATDGGKELTVHQVQQAFSAQGIDLVVDKQQIPGAVFLSTFDISDPDFRTALMKDETPIKQQALDRFKANHLKYGGNITCAIATDERDEDVRIAFTDHDKSSGLHENVAPNVTCSYSTWTANKKLEAQPHGMYSEEFIEATEQLEEKSGRKILAEYHYDSLTVSAQFNHTINDIYLLLH